MHIFKMDEWYDCGYWHCNDISDLGHNSGAWWHPARILKMDPADYLKWVIDNYKPDKVNYSADASVVWFEWKNQDKMRKFKNYINAQARKAGYEV